MRSLLLALLGCLLLLNACDARSYASHSIFRVKSPSKDLLQELQERFDVWGQKEGSFFVFAQKSEFQSFMLHNGQDYDVVPSSVQSDIEGERLRLASRTGAGWFEDYHNLNDTMTWYQDQATSFPKIATFVESIGKSWEGRDIFAFKIAGTSAAKKIWIQCNIHAREWITNAVCQYPVNEILQGYGKDSSITDLVDNLEFVFIPIVNPDGYSFTWTDDRMWRKNRRSNGGSYGVDLNRNFDQQWGGVGSSHLPSSDTYCGPSPLSEPETQALSKYYNGMTGIIAAIDVHSYSQYILRPFSHTSTPPSNDPALKQVSQEMASIIKGVHGKTYTPGIWYTQLYPSSGVAQDYYAVRGSFSLTIELRPTTTVPGFILPPEEIIPTGEEITPAVLHFARFSLENNLA